MKEFAEWFYKSRAWRRVRKAYIDYRKSIDGGLCEKCRTELGYIVHHKEELTAWNIHNPEIALGFDNLEFVCKNCHELIHKYCGQISIRPPPAGWDNDTAAWLAWDQLFQSTHPCGVGRGTE